MNPANETPAGRDPALWRLARRRAKFKAHLGTFLFVNTVIWLVWALTGQPTRPVPWPLWITGFWGLALAAQAYEVYGYGGRGLAEREYERLLRQR